MYDQRVEQFDRFEATFQPKRTDDLKPGVAELIGRRLEWEALYVLGGDDEVGEYDGQFACSPLTDQYLGFAWVPECDLADVSMRGDGWGLQMDAAAVASLSRG